MAHCRHAVGAFGISSRLLHTVIEDEIKLQPLCLEGLLQSTSTV